MFTSKSRFIPAVFVGCSVLSAPGLFAQSTPGNVKDVVIREDTGGWGNSDPAAAKFDRNELTIVVTRHAWNLELAGPTGDRHVVIEAGHDSGVTCSDTALQAHLITAGTPGTGGIEIWAGDFEFQSVSTSSPVYHQTTTWDDGSGSTAFGSKVTISAMPADTELEWSGLGANETFRVGTTTDDASISGRDHGYTVSTEVVSHGVYGASIYTIVESNGFRTEYLTETVEVFGLEDANGADADTITPGTTDPLGCCSFPCGAVTNVTSSECDRFPGTSWVLAANCTTTNPTSNFCGGGTLADPNGRDDLEFQDGHIDPLDSACGTEDGPGTGAPTRHFNGMASVAPAPIEQVTGEKIEGATDLTVDLSGTDFHLTRRHRSIGNSSNTLIGNGWAMGVFSFLDIGTSTPPALPSLTLKAPQGFVEYTPSIGVWTSGGPTAQTIERAVAFIDGRSDGLPVYRLTEPGGWQMDFHRAEDTSVDTNVAPSSLLPPSSWYGLLHRRIDLAGNRWTFDYTEVNGKVRLASITCDRHDEDGSYKIEARISFKWKGANSQNNAGRLASVAVARPTGSGTWLATHSVSYRYFDDLLLEGNTAAEIAHLGSSGDLVQVTVSERLDDDGSTAVWRDRVTQYRYHDGSQYDTTAETIDVDSDNDGIPGEQGQKHQLKMVFNPFEVEYFAEHYRSGGAGVSLLSAADRLLRLEDDAVAFNVDTLGGTGAPSGENVQVARLASKVIARYDTSNRVLVQYLQASCGCSGLNGTLGVRRKYDYGYYEDTLSGLEYYRFTLTEASDADGNGSFDDYRIYRTHHRTQTVGGVPRLYIESIEDSATGDTWYKAYEYTSNGELLAAINASALSSYFPAGGTGSMGTITISSTAGHVMGYEYDSASRLKAVYFRSGYNGDPTTNPSGWEKLESFERTNGTRADLVTKHIRYRVAGSSGVDDQEVTTYDYRFWDPVGSGATELDGQFDGHIIAYKKTSVERELTSENGPGIGTYDTEVVFDVNGRKVLERTADGSLTEYFYSGNTEYLTKVVRNQGSPTWSLPNTNEFTVLGGAWTPLTGRTDGGALTTEFVRDDLGRIVESIAPGGITTYTYRTRSSAPSRGNANLLYFSEITLPHPISESGSNYDRFADVATQTWLDASNLTAEVRGYEMPSSVAKTNYRTEAQAHVDAATTAGLVASRSAINIDWATKSIEQRVWHDASDAAASYLSQAQFDEFGRTLWQKNAVGDFTEYTYDVIDRVLTVSRGTDRSTGSNNLVLVETRYYDGSSSGSIVIGDSNLTQIVRHVDSTPSNDRITSIYYDVRNRVVFVENPLAPHSYTKYDNLNRPTEQHQVSELTYSDTSSLTQTDRSKRIRTTKTAYSQRGLVYETAVKIDPTSASDVDFLVNSMWFDEVGRVAKSQPHSGAGTKTAFDGLGREVHRFVGDMTGDGSSFTNVYNTTSHKPVVTGDIILQETVTDYITTATRRGFGGPELVTNYERAHDASSTGSLSDFDGTGVDATAVATYSVMIYDEASRLAKSGYYGTNDSSGYFAGGIAPTPPMNAFSLSAGVASMPSGALTSETVYDDRGRAHVSIAPDGTRTRTIFDDLNRTLATIENDQSGSVVTLSWDAVNSRWSTTNAGSSTSAQNRVTSFVYDDVSNLIKRVAHVDDSNVQETDYDYSYDGTLFDSNSLLAAVHYPDEGSGNANSAAAYTVSYEYNRQGDMTKMTDQNGTVHEYVHDALGRVTLDKVTTFTNTDLDDTVQAIETLYSSTTGLVEYVTSYDGTDPSTATALNQIKYEYDSLLQLSKYRQNPTGEVGTGQSADVEYVYDRVSSGSGNYSRLDSIKYPLVNTGGKQRTEVSQYYGSTTFPTDLDHRISRSRGLDWTFQMKSVATDEIRYEHLGLNNAVIVDYPDGEIILDRQVDPNYTPAGGTGPRVSGEYAGMDQYGRLGRQVWYKGSTWDPDNLPARIDVAYAYDSNSDITRRYDSRVGASMSDRGDEYDYDGLNRLELATRGAPGSGSSWTSASKTEDWTLDTFGNWTAYSNSIGTSYTEDRTHNAANEITDIELNSTTPKLEVTYDDAGNLRTRETLADTIRWVYTWDAWNRLVKVDIQGYSGGMWQTPVERMASGYYGMNQRAWSQIDEGAAGYANNGVPQNDLTREEHFYYDASWRLLERRTDVAWGGSTFTHDQTTQWVWGNRYIDELVAYAVDTAASTSEFDTVTYAMTDRNFSVIGLVGSERVRYDAYGYAQASPFGDANSDGTVDGSDQSIILAAFGDSVGDAGYQVEGDLNFSGTVDTADLNLYTPASGDSIDRGRLSGEGNIIGYAGYVFEPATGLYVSRQRWYQPASGRWISSDPMGYYDGASLYQYVKSSPIAWNDPSGLAAAKPKEGDTKRGRVCSMPMENCGSDGTVAQVSLSMTVRADIKAGLGGKIIEFGFGSGVSFTGTATVTLQPCTAAKLCADYFAIYVCIRIRFDLPLSTPRGKRFDIPIRIKRCGWAVVVTRGGVYSAKTSPNCCTKKTACFDGEAPEPIAWSFG